MNEPDIKRWTAKRKAALVKELLRGQTTVAEAARQHDLLPSEIEKWVEDAEAAMENAHRDGEEKHVTLDHTSPMLQQLLYATRIILPCTLLLLAVDQLPFVFHPLDRGQIIGRDAFNFWMAGKLAFEGQADSIYDNTAFMHAVHDMLGPGAGLHVFPYPPPSLLFVAAFGWLPYWLTLLLWSLLGLGAFMLATTAPHPDRRLLLLSLIAPLSLCNLTLGQNGLLSAALFIGGLRLAHSRPVLAGMLIGCLAYKPMLALLLPLALLLERRWLVIASAGATLVMLCVLPALLWGAAVWHDYLTKAVPFQQLLLEHGTGLAQPMKLTSFISMRLAGFDIGPAYQMQTGFALATMALLLTYGWRRRRTGRLDGLDITILATATMIMLPYTHFYDMTLMAGGLLLMSRDDTIRKDAPLLRSTMPGLLWALPILGLIANIVGLPISPIILLIGLALLCQAPHRT